MFSVRSVLNEFYLESDKLKEFLVAPLRAHNDCCFDSRRLASGNFVITGIT
jgi:hypothetical protein